MKAWLCENPIGPEALNWREVPTPELARIIRDVVLPMVGTSLLSAMLTVAALSIGEFQLSNLIAGFLSRTYPIVLLQAFYGATGLACAATVILLVLAVAASLLSSATARLARAA